MEPLILPKRAKRIQKLFIVRFRISGEIAFCDDLSKWHMVTIKNLSSSGICFNFNKKIPVNTRIELNIKLPFINEPVNCLGKVCRIDEDRQYNAGYKKNPIYGIATFFERIDNNVKEVIDRFAENSNFKT
ncbi:MAG: PilZ domain-containing protein [bacterium]|nr:PilZ domain-containing protein [bacterium]